MSLASRRQPRPISRALWVFFFVAGSLAPTLALAKPDDSDTPEEGVVSPSKERVRLRFELGGLGYQGQLNRQEYAAPAGATMRSQRHGGELVGGFFNAEVKRDGVATTYHTENGRAGFLFGGTRTPQLSGAATGKAVPRHGFNFGFFGDFRENAGIAVGGICGGAFSGIAGSSVKAFTRSTVSGNHLEVDLGTAAGLHCGPDDMLILLQYGIEGDLGVEQMQDLASQQGLDSYDRKEGNGLLFYAGHGPRLLVVRDSDRVHAALSAEYIRSIGAGKWGGKRQGLRAMLSFALGEKTAFGIAPWYRLDIVDYAGASKVTDPNDRLGHTFGFSFVAVRAHKK